MDPINKFAMETGKRMREKLDVQILGRTLRLQELKFQAIMEHLEKIRPIRELALIYRALRGDEHAMRECARRNINIRLVKQYHYEVYMTFYEFIKMNWLPIYEEVLR